VPPKKQRPAPHQPAGSSRRRPAERPKGRPDLPILAIVAAGGVLVVFAVLFVIYHVTTTPSTPNTSPIAGVRCDAGEQKGKLYHAHLTILYQGTPVPVPNKIGNKGSCLYWLHTTDDTGVITIALPKDAANRQFTLGQFFQIWGQPLQKGQVATLNVGQGEQVRVWVNGKPHQGDPANVPLTSHADVVVQIGPPFQEPPPNYTWDPASYPN
jgi:hypothetical protein